MFFSFRLRLYKKKKKKKKNKKLNISKNVRLKDIEIKKSFNIFHLLYLIIFV